MTWMTEPGSAVDRPPEGGGDGVLDPDEPAGDLGLLDGGPSGHRPRRHVVGRTALAVGATVAVLVAVLATSKSASQVEAASPLLGKPAPPVDGPALDGPVASLTGLRGRWVLVNFFASWCVPCRSEMPQLVRFAHAHAATGDAVVFGVRFDDPDDQPLRELQAKDGARWPIVDDSGAKVRWGVAGIPESYLVDPNGIVLSRIVSGVNADALEALLARAKAAEGRAP
jgi:cytochrome c biogenesis protein CcmG/thiol:disulfide interchange protein DsbE